MKQFIAYTFILICLSSIFNATGQENPIDIWNLEKKKPSQTQKKKIRKRIELQLYFCEGSFYRAYLEEYNDGNCTYGKKISYQKFKEKRLTKIATGGRFELFYIQSEKPNRKIAVLMSCNAFLKSLDR